MRAFWARVRQGLTILRDRRRYLREVFAVQFGGWLCRFTAFWFLLEAFNIGGSVKNVLLVLGVNAVAAAVPFTPGGAGVQQAFLVKVFAGVAAASTVAAINRINVQGSADQQAEQIRSVIATVFPEAVTLVREAREGLQ